MTETEVGPPPPALVIIDDEPDHALIVRRLSQELVPELAIEVATDAAGLADCARQAPHGALLLVDRILEGREVFDQLPALRTARPDLTIAVLSAALSDADRERALAAGADRAAQKPGKIGEWRILLSDLLSLAERQRAAVARARPHAERQRAEGRPGPVAQ